MDTQPVESQQDQKSQNSSTIPLDSDPNHQFGGLEARSKLERRLVRRLDIRMSILILVYIFSYIDRTNAAAARLRGFEEDLNLKGNEFATVLSVFFIGYMLVQVPSNMYLNYTRKPSLYLPGCMVLWGLVSCLTGVAHDFTGALLARFFLGIVEAAFFPGAMFLLSKWYKRTELGLRTAILFAGNIIGNAFGSLLASGILSGMEGKLGVRAWRWLFFIEGALTIFVALIAIFILPDFPLTTRWLSENERKLALLRMEEDAGIGDEGQTEKPEGTRGSRYAHGLKLALGDWLCWWFALALASQIVSLSFTTYFPTLAATLGYNRTVTLLLCAPPFAFAAVVAFTLSRHSDKTGDRFNHIALSFSGSLLGFIIAIATMNTTARYIALFLMAQAYAGFVILLTWISNSFPRPPSKRAAALAFILAFSQFGNVSGSYVWPTRWGPTYRYSYGICIATNAISIIMLWIAKRHLRSLNLTFETEEAEQKKVHKGFRYLL